MLILDSDCQFPESQTLLTQTSAGSQGDEYNQLYLYKANMMREISHRNTATLINECGYKIRSTLFRF